MSKLELRANPPTSLNTREHEKSPCALLIALIPQAVEQDASKSDITLCGEHNDFSCLVIKHISFPSHTSDGNKIKAEEKK